MTARAIAAIAGALVALSASCRCEAPPPAQQSSVPACRMDAVRPVVARTFAEAFRHARGAASLNASGFAINPSIVNAAQLGLYLVTDARNTEVDASGCIRAGAKAGSIERFDELSIRGICVAREQSVYCSAAAVRSILDHDPDPASPVSAFLFYVFMHELGHISSRDPGAFRSSDHAIDLSRSRQQTLGQLSTACLADHEQLGREVAADSFALAALSTAYQQPPFSVGYKHAAEAYIVNSERAYQSAHALLEWAADYYGNDSGLVAPFADDVCELLERTTGLITLPALGGSHPHEWERIARLMVTINSAVTKLGIPADADPRLRQSVSAMQMNAMLAEVRSRTLEAFTKQICSEVAGAQGNSLDCGPAAIERRKRVLLPEPAPTADNGGGATITFPLGKPHRDPRGAPLAMVVSISTMQDLPTAQRAQEEADRFATLTTRFLAELDHKLDAAGGYVVRHNDAYSRWERNDFLGTYSFRGDVNLVLRVDDSLDPDALAASKPLKDHSYDLVANRLPWSDERHVVVMQFYPTDQASDRDSKRVMSKPQAFDFVYDLAKARAGEPNVIAPEFRRLLCYARVRLERWYRHPFSLTPRTGRSAFYVADVMFDLPEDWIPMAERDCPDVTQSDRNLVGRLRNLADYGKTPQDVDSKMFDEMFAGGPRASSRYRADR